uniref:Uncharacterized protein n=1 Tax=Anguilla anguilla TaxID=7936 RepID=A0A0E9QKJ4_ANGAN
MIPDDIRLGTVCGIMWGFSGEVTPCVLFGGHPGLELAFVQSLYRTSKSFLEMSLHLLTPGWIAPSPRKMRTCSTLHTTGVISNLFSLV